MPHDSLSYSTADFLRDVFGRCNGEDLIAFASRRTHPTHGHTAILPLAPIPVGELAQWLPGILDHETQNTQYLCLNPLHRRAALGRDTATHFDRMATAGGSYLRKSQRNITALSTIALDLDVGRPGTITAAAAMAILFDMCDRSEVPWPTILAKSGRGLYALWLLRQQDSNAPPPSTPGNVHSVNRVTSELLHLLRNLESDFTSKDYSKWFKRPETVDTKTGNEVVYFRVNPSSTPSRHTLPDLCSALGIQVTAPQLHHRQAPEPRGPRAPRAGHRPPRGSEPAAARVADLDRLLPHIEPGRRHIYLLYYFNGVFRLWRYLDPAKAKREAASAVQEQNKRLRECRVDSVPSVEVQTQIIDRRPFSRLVTTKRVVSDLQITSEVAERFGLLHLLPASLVAQRANEQTEARSARQVLASQVDASLLQAHADGRKVSPTQLARSLGLGDYKQYINSRRRRLVKLGKLPESTPARQTRLLSEDS